MPATEILALLAPVIVAGWVVGGIGTRGLIQSRQQQVTPSRAVWLTWASGWSFALVGLAVGLVIAAMHVWALTTSGHPLIDISVGTSN